MLKYAVGIVALVLLAVGGFYLWNGGKKATPNETAPAVEASVSTYATSTFSVSYRADFTVNDSYSYEGVPKKPISGVKFTVPASIAAGTNLSSDSGVSVESLPRAKNCTGDIYLFDTVRPVSMTVGSTTYSVATTSDAGAGNFYEEQVYAITGSSPCTAVRYFIHSRNIGNFEPGVAVEFDRAALLSAFDAIRDSLVLAR
jgi:hypothetical protein